MIDAVRRRLPMSELVERRKPTGFIGPRDLSGGDEQEVSFWMDGSINGEAISRQWKDALVRIVFGYSLIFGFILGSIARWQQVP